MGTWIVLLIYTSKCDLWPVACSDNFWVFNSVQAIMTSLTTEFAGKIPDFVKAGEKKSAYTKWFQFLEVSSSQIFYKSFQHWLLRRAHTKRF